MRAHEFLSKDACPVCGQTPCNCTHVNEDLRKWFKEKWVRFGPDGKIRGDCARGSDSEGKPKCLPQSKAHALGKKGRASAAARKRREDPNPERRGPAKNVATKKKTNEQQIDEKCWDGYHKEGNKELFGKTVPNCVKNEDVQQCPECGGPMFSELMINEKQDACYYKVKSRYKVWPSAYASGALVQCRKKGAKNWGNKSKNEGQDMKINQVVAEAANPAQQAAIAIAMKKKGDKPKKMSEHIDDGDYNGEYDDEAGMADNNLETLKRAVQGIDDIIQPGDNLPEWCQEKIAVAKSMLVNVWDYMRSEEERQLAEEFDLIERIIESIAAHNGVDADAVWTDLESLTEDELYAFAVTSQLNEDWQKANKRDKTDGMSRKAVKAYRREHPGSKLQTAVTTKPSKLKKGSKASKRRKSYCSRSRGQMKMHNISCAKTPDKAICKARRRWNC